VGRELQKNIVKSSSNCVLSHLNRAYCSYWVQKPLNSASYHMLVACWCHL